MLLLDAMAHGQIDPVEPETIARLVQATADAAQNCGGRRHRRRSRRQWAAPLVKLPPVTTGHERANGAGAFFKNMIGAALMLTTVGVGASWIYVVAFGYRALPLTCCVPLRLFDPQCAGHKMTAPTVGGGTGSADQHNYSISSGDAVCWTADTRCSSRIASQLRKLSSVTPLSIARSSVFICSKSFKRRSCSERSF